MAVSLPETVAAQADASGASVLRSRRSRETDSISDLLIHSGFLQKVVYLSFLPLLLTCFKEIFELLVRHQKRV